MDYVMPRDVAGNTPLHLVVIQSQDYGLPPNTDQDDIPWEKKTFLEDSYLAKAQELGLTVNLVPIRALSPDPNPMIPARSHAPCAGHQAVRHGVQAHASERGGASRDPGTDRGLEREARQ